MDLYIEKQPVEDAVSAHKAQVSDRELVELQLVLVGGGIGNCELG
jgi:hypothetical protein